MSKKNKKINCGKISSQQQFDAQKPQYRPACRCGKWEDKRNKREHKYGLDWKVEID